LLLASVYSVVTQARAVLAKYESQAKRSSAKRVDPGLVDEPEGR
jgi:hypothetical protein